MDLPAEAPQQQPSPQPTAPRTGRHLRDTVWVPLLLGSVAAMLMAALRLTL